MASNLTTDFGFGSNQPAHDATETTQDATSTAEVTARCDQQAQLTAAAPNPSSPVTPYATSTPAQRGPDAGNPTQPVLTPKKWCEEIISLYVKVLLLRAKEVYRHGDIDWTSFWSPVEGPDNSTRGFSVSDGFDRTWFVPSGGLRPLPRQKDMVALQQRIDAFQRLASQPDSRFVAKVIAIFDLELREKCQSDWNEEREATDGPLITWEAARSKFSELQIVGILAKRRLIDGRALLPKYYRVNIIEISDTGALFARREAIPGDVDVEGIRLRLDTWSPVDNVRTRDSMRAIRRKLDVVHISGTAMGQKKATNIQRGVDRSNCDHLREGGHWFFKLRVDHNYTLKPGKGPGKMDSWTPLGGTGSLDLLKEGVLDGKLVIFARVSSFSCKLDSDLMNANSSTQSGCDISGFNWAH